MMKTHEYELKFLKAAASDLKNYILSGEVYWDIGARPPRGGRPYPHFSLGWLLLYRRRVAADGLNRKDQEILREISETEAQWRASWSRKAAQEYSMRLKLWTRFLNDFKSNPGANRDRYPYEVQRRTMLELLASEADDLPDVEVQLLQTLDSALRGMLISGDFIEDPAHASQFPPDRFWFLYGMLR